MTKFNLVERPQNASNAIQIGITLLILVVLYFFEYFLIDISSTYFLKVIVLAICTCLKMGAVWFILVNSIFKNIMKGVSYHVYLLFIFLALFIFILNFTSDFYYVYVIDNQSFKGIPSGSDTLNILFGFLFLSTMFFTMQGVMDLMPSSILAETYILIESIATYISFIFFLSNFSSLRKTIKIFKEK